MIGAGDSIDIEVIVHPRVYGTAFQEAVAEARIDEAGRTLRDIVARTHTVTRMAQYSAAVQGPVRVALTIDKELSGEEWRALIEEAMADENFLLDFASATVSRASGR